LHAASHQVFLKTWFIFVACILARREVAVESDYVDSQHGVCRNHLHESTQGTETMMRIGQDGLPIWILALFAVTQNQFVGEALAQPVSEALTRDSQQVIVAFSPDIPPYVMHKATQGLQVDIVRDALSLDSFRAVQLPYKQLQRQFRKSKPM
jgi:hypothetical protein